MYDYAIAKSKKFSFKIKLPHLNTATCYILKNAELLLWKKVCARVGDGGFKAATCLPVDYSRRDPIIQDVNRFLQCGEEPACYLCLIMEVQCQFELGWIPVSDVPAC